VSSPDQIPPYPSDPVHEYDDDQWYTPETMKHLEETITLEMLTPKEIKDCYNKKARVAGATLYYRLATPYDKFTTWVPFRQLYPGRAIQLGIDALLGQ